MSTIYIVPGSVVKIWLGIWTLNSPKVDSNFSHKIIILDQISLLLQGYMPIEQDYWMYSAIVFNSIVELSHHIFCYMEPMVSRVAYSYPLLDVKFQSLADLHCTMTFSYSLWGIYSCTTAWFPACPLIDMLTAPQLGWIWTTSLK